VVNKQLKKLVPEVIYQVWLDHCTSAMSLFQLDSICFLCRWNNLTLCSFGSQQS
jgi:hypothetical protein